VRGEKEPPCCNECKLYPGKSVLPYGSLCKRGAIMERSGKTAGRLLRLAWLLLVLAAPGLAWGAEFSAQMQVKDGVKTIPGKIYVQDGKMRQEFADVEGQTITIVRPDLKVVWMILSRQRSYMEMPLKLKVPGQFIQIPPQALGRLLVGKERLNGYDTDKIQVSIPGPPGMEIQTFWIAPKLGLPIKMECKAREFSLEYKSIKEEKVPDRLFNLPPGLKKLTTPSGFGDQVE
jgi:hypothetical protein